MSSKSKRKYTTTHIPTVMATDIRTVIDSDIGAYCSVSEFVKDAIRRLLDYYGFYPKKLTAKRK